MQTSKKSIYPHVVHLNETIKNLIRGLLFAVERGKGAREAKPKIRPNELQMIAANKTVDTYYAC